MTNNKTNIGTWLSWILLFVILVALGLTTYKAYVSIKIQEDIYSKIWATVTPKTEDDEGNKIDAVNVVYKMNIYDYTDAVLVNIPVGSNNCYYDWEHKLWAHDKGYIKYLKSEDGTLTFDGVILHHGYDISGIKKHEIIVLPADSQDAKEFLYKTFEYIFVGELKSIWTTDCGKPTIDFDKLYNVEYDYLITWQQQTEEAHTKGGLFTKMYDGIVQDGKASNITTKTYTKQFYHNTSELQYIKCFKDNECINANIYCEYTRHMFTHSLPTDINLAWYDSEILGGNV